LQYATGSSGFKIWKENGGSGRILNSSGLVGNGWQKQLTRAGTAFGATDFTTGSNIAGRVCPAHVFLSHSSMTATGRCLYYDSGNAAQALDAASGTLGEDRLVAWTNASSARGTGASYYEGNIKTCADKGMRLPTAYETTMPAPSDLPDGDSITPTFATTNGVPSTVGSTFTASASKTGTYYDANQYITWNDSNGFALAQSWTTQNQVRCVLPSSSDGGGSASAPSAPTLSGYDSTFTSNGQTYYEYDFCSSSVNVSFTAGDNGGSAITNYQLSQASWNGSNYVPTTWNDFSPVKTTSPILFTFLNSSMEYFYFIRAKNAVGTGPTSGLIYLFGCHVY
jgi:hypothetical protein